LEWPFVLAFAFGGLAILLLSGMPIAFAFMLINLVGVFLFWGGQAGLIQLSLSMYSSVATFTLLPVPMFILMGEVIFQTGVGFKVMDVLDEWLGRLPGRLGLMAVAGGTLFACLSGSAMGSCALLGSVLTPEMEKRGYKKPMSLGPILGSGGVAILIPPSSLAVILASIGEFSIGRLLIGIVVPGLASAVLKAMYIILRCKFQPSIAPVYDVAPPPIVKRLSDTAQYVLPLGFIIFLVIGLIFVGVASPTESAAAGAFGCFLLALTYKRLNWGAIKKSFVSTLSITVMIFMILTGSIAFSQILAFTGVTASLTELAVNLPIHPIFLLMMMQLLLLFLGCFIDQISMMMVGLPIMMPIVTALGWDPIWFGAIYLINLEIGCTTPPFGVVLFVMKGVAPPDTTMGDLYRAALPFIICDVIVLGLMMAFPEIVLWLPGLMR